MIFIMAASGEVGRETVQFLLKQGAAPKEIAGGARNPSKLADLTALGIDVRRADYTDLASMETAFRGSETLVLIPTKTPSGPRCVEHANALEAAQKAGVKRVVFLSLQAATPLSHFNVAPFILFAECATRQSGLDWTFARMSLYADPIAEWVPELVNIGTLPYPVEQARIAYVSRTDVSRSLAAIALKPDLHGQILELTGPAALSMPELAQTISQVTGTPITFKSISEDEYRELCRKDKLPDEITDILVTMYRAAEAQEFSHVSNDIESLTGRRPETMAEALRRLAPTGNLPPTGDLRP